MQEIDYHIIKRSLNGGDDEYGDTGLVREYDGLCFMALIDALGHGKEAFDFAFLVERYLTSHDEQGLTTILKGRPCSSKENPGCRRCYLQTESSNKRSG